MDRASAEGVYKRGEGWKVMGVWVCVLPLTHWILLQFNQWRV